MDQAPAAPAETPDLPADFPSVGGILSAGTNVASENAGLFFGLWAVCGLPSQILGLVVGLSTGIRDNEAYQRALDAQDWAALGPLAVVGIIATVFGLLGYAATILVTARAHQGRKSELIEALTSAAGRLPALLGASLLTAAAVVMGGIAFIIPGLYLVVRLSLAVCASVLETKGPVASLKRSWELAGGRFWSLTGAIGAFVGVAFAGAVVLLVAGRVLGAVASPAAELGEAAVKIAVNAGQFMISAWVTACMTKLFLELSARGPRAS